MKKTPALGIMLTSQFNDADFYRIACECGGHEHDVTMVVAVSDEPDTDCINVEFYVETTTPFWHKGFSRIKAAWDILVHGYRQDSHALMLSKTAATNLCDAITESIKRIESK